MNVLIVDTETTGLDPAQGAELIEVGAILYNVPTRSTLAQTSTLLRVKTIGQEETHGISLEASHSIPFNIQSASLNVVSNMAMGADYAIAHQSSFDSQFTQKLVDIPWLCTYDDFCFAPYKKSNLVSLALSHGIAVKSAHRALTDCQLLAEIFSKRVDLEELIEKAVIRASSPKVLVKAIVGYADRDKAKAANFRWDDKLKIWKKSIKECDLDQLNIEWELIK